MRALAVCVMGLTLAGFDTGTGDLLKIRKAPTLTHPSPQVAFVDLNGSPFVVRVFKGVKGVYLETRVDTLNRVRGGFASRHAQVVLTDSGHAVKFRYGDLQVDTVVRDCGCRGEYRGYRNRLIAFQRRAGAVEWLESGVLRGRPAGSVFDSLYRDRLEPEEERLEPALFERRHREFVDSLRRVLIETRAPGN